MELIQKLFKWKPTRDNNYYFGMLLLVIGILTIVLYLLIDGFEPLAFLITFLVCGWGFVLLWKSDNDFRFKLAEERVAALERELGNVQNSIATTPENPEILSDTPENEETPSITSQNTEMLSTVNKTTDMLTSTQENPDLLSSVPENPDLL